MAQKKKIEFLVECYEHIARLLDLACSPIIISDDGSIAGTELPKKIRQLEKSLMEWDGGRLKDRKLFLLIALYNQLAEKIEDNEWSLEKVFKEVKAQVDITFSKSFLDISDMEMKTHRSSIGKAIQAFLKSIFNFNFLPASASFLKKSGFFSTDKDLSFHKKPTKEQLNKKHSYSINLMWINDKKDDSGDYVCSGKTKKEMNNQMVKQLEKWHSANPGTEINLWFDSQRTNEKAINNTKELLEEVGSKYLVKLRDIREIPIVRDNPDLFSSKIPSYFLIDILKLIICVYEMETGKKDSAIYADQSIGEKVYYGKTEKELYERAVLKKLYKFGMLFNSDAANMVENQFIQTLNSPELIESMKHAVNCCLHIASNNLNHAFRKQKPNYLTYLYNIPFGASRILVHAYFLFITTNRDNIKIRADIVKKEGRKDEWITYDPKIHGYILYGNIYLHEKACVYFDGNKTEALEAIIRLPENLTLEMGNENSLQDRGYISNWRDHKNYIARDDLNPAHIGREHPWEVTKSDIPKPQDGKQFKCTYWALDNKNIKLDQENEAAFEAALVLEFVEAYRELSGKEQQIPSASFWMNNRISPCNKETKLKDLFHHVLVNGEDDYCKVMKKLGWINKKGELGKAFRDIPLMSTAFGRAEEEVKRLIGSR